MSEFTILFGKKCTPYLKDVEEISEGFFKTNNDLTQMKSDYKLFKQIVRKFPLFFSVILIDEKVCGSLILLPCDKKMKKLFLEGKITESELASRILKRKTSSFESIYLAEISLKKEFHNKRFGTKLLKEGINRIYKKYGKKFPVFFWGWSKQGKKYYPEY